MSDDLGAALLQRAQRLMLLSMLVALAVLKDWPPASCGKD